MHHSGTGIYGALDAGMTGNVTILMSKSVLDFFTALIFACSLGIITSVIAVPVFDLPLPVSFGETDLSAHDTCYDQRL